MIIDLLLDIILPTPISPVGLPPTTPAPGALDASYNSDATFWFRITGPSSSGSGGSKGQKGESGTDGADGAKGIAGVKGDTGAQGITAKELKELRGTDGIDGAKGIGLKELQENSRR